MLHIKPNTKQDSHKSWRGPNTLGHRFSKFGRDEPYGSDRVAAPMMVALVQCDIYHHQILLHTMM